MSPENNQLIPELWVKILTPVVVIFSTLLGTSTMVHPLEGGQQTLSKQLLEMSEANKKLNLQMLEVVQSREKVFKDLNERLDAIERKMGGGK